VADGSLWRLSGTPTFTLTVYPNRWLLQPGTDGKGRVVVGSREGFTDTVALRLIGFPATIPTDLMTAPVTAGQHVTFTLQIAAEAIPGIYPATLLGTSGTVTQTAPLTVSIVTELQTDYLPIVRSESPQH